MPERCWIAVIADLQGSRRIEEPKQFAKRLALALRVIGERFEDEWRAPLMMTGGLDRLSGVLKHPQHGFDVAVDLNLRVWPERYRIAVAAGPLHVGMNTRRAAAMHGPAFHHAAVALDRGRTNDLPFAIDLGAELRAECELAESMARLHGVIMEGWTKARARAATLYRELGRQQEVAARLGISQQAVSEALAGAHHGRLKAAEKAMRTWMSRAFAEGEQR